MNQKITIIAKTCLFILKYVQTKNWVFTDINIAHVHVHWTLCKHPNENISNMKIYQTWKYIKHVQTSQWKYIKIPQEAESLLKQRGIPLPSSPRELNMHCFTFLHCAQILLSEFKRCFPESSPNQLVQFIGRKVPRLTGKSSGSGNLTCSLGTSLSHMY